MHFILDTTICNNLMDHRPPQVVERFPAMDKDEVVLSLITLAEPHCGVQRLTRTNGAAEHAVALLLELVPAVPFDADAAVRYGIPAAAVRVRWHDALDCRARAESGRRPGYQQRSRL
jgi:tRNA(fMet)-specific endonuclease VapC